MDKGINGTANSPIGVSNENKDQRQLSSEEVEQWVGLNAQHDKQSKMACRSCKKDVPKLSLQPYTENVKSEATQGVNCGKPICDKCSKDRSLTKCKPRHESQNKVIKKFKSSEQTQPGCSHGEQRSSETSSSLAPEAKSMHSPDITATKDNLTTAKEISSKKAKMPIKGIPEFVYTEREEYLAWKIYQNLDASDAEVFFLLFGITKDDYAEAEKEFNSYPSIAFKALFDRVIQKYRAENKSKELLDDVVNKLKTVGGVNLASLAETITTENTTNSARRSSDASTQSWPFDMHSKYLHEIHPHIDKFGQFITDKEITKPEIINKLFKMSIQKKNIGSSFRFLMLCSGISQNNKKLLFDEFLESMSLWSEYAETIAEYYNEFEQLLKTNRVLEEPDDRFSTTLKNSWFDYKSAVYSLLNSLRDKTSLQLHEVLGQFSECHPTGQPFNLDRYGFGEMPRENDNMEDDEIRETYAQTIADHYDAFKAFVKGHNLMENVNVDEVFSKALTKNSLYSDFLGQSAFDMLKELRDGYKKKFGFPLKGILNEFCNEHPTNILFNLDKYGFEAMPRDNDNMKYSDLREAFAQAVAEHYDAFRVFVKDHNLMANVDNEFLNALTHNANMILCSDFFELSAFDMLKKLRDDHKNEHGLPLKGILNLFRHDNPTNPLFNLDEYRFEPMPRENDNLSYIEIRETYAQIIADNYDAFKVFVKGHNLMENVDDEFSNALTNNANKCFFSNSFNQSAIDLLEKLRDDHKNKYGFTLKGILNKFRHEHPKN